MWARASARSRTTRAAQAQDHAQLSARQPSAAEVALTGGEAPTGAHGRRCAGSAMDDDEADFRRFVTTRWSALVYTAFLITTDRGIRSEERRVGKECRSRWWPYQEQKKVDN